MFLFGAVCSIAMGAQALNYYRKEVKTMNENVRDVLRLLMQLRAEVHGNVENSVIEKLDQAIQKLDAAQCRNSRKLSRDHLLAILGKVVQMLPAVAELIERLTTK